MTQHDRRGWERLVYRVLLVLVLALVILTLMTAVARLRAQEPDPLTAPAALVMRVTRAQLGSSLESLHPVISTDGRYLTFFELPKGPVGLWALGTLCVYDRQAGTIIARIPRASLAGISAQGQLQVFTPGNGHDMARRDLATGSEQLVNVATDGSHANKSARQFCQTDDGCVIVFTTDASNLVPGDSPGGTDIFAHVMQTRRTDCISITMEGVPANRYSYDPLISADGRFVAFTSLASCLTPGDANNVADVFVRDRVKGTTTCISRTANGMSANAESRAIDLTPDGKYLLFSSSATDLVTDKARPVSRLYIANLSTGTLEPVQLKEQYLLLAGRALSFDGRYLLFTARKAYHIREESDVYGNEVYLLDRTTGAEVVVSGGSVDIQQRLGLPYHDNIDPSMSADGRYVCYLTRLGNVSPRSSAGIPWEKKWNGIRYHAFAVNVYDSIERRTTAVHVVTDLPETLPVADK